MLFRRITAWKTRLRCACLMAMATLSLPAATEPLELTLWPIPGIVNVVDGRPTDGLTVEALQLLMARLPDLQPEYRLANRLRQQHLMEQGQDFCSLPLLRRDDTDEYAYFVPFMASTPIQAVVRRRDLPHLPLERGDLSLHRLLAETRFTAGRSGFRTYPAAIDAWLTQASDLGRAETVTGSQNGANLLSMVSHGRIDISFELASISLALTRDLQLPEPLVSLPIKEHRELFETGIYCTRSPWGHAMAQRLDGAVRELAAEPEALLALYVRAMPEDTWAVFAEEMADYYRQRGSRPTALAPPKPAPRYAGQ